MVTAISLEGTIINYICERASEKGPSGYKLHLHGNRLKRSQVINQQIWKIWSNFMCPLGPFLLARSHILLLPMKRRFI